MNLQTIQIRFVDYEELARENPDVVAHFEERHRLELWGLSDGLRAMDLVMYDGWSETAQDYKIRKHLAPLLRQCLARRRKK